jgi:hypothetical protein
MENEKAIVKAADEATTDARAVNELVEGIKIRDDNELDTAVKWVAVIKSQHKEVKDQKEQFTKPLRDVVSKISTFFDRPLKAFEEAEAKVKQKIQEHINERGQKRAELLGKVEELNQEERAQAIEKATELVAPKIPGMSVRETWKGQVEDPNDLLGWIITNKHFEYISINTKALEAYTKKIKTDPQIPGWKAYPQSTVAITVSKVEK